MWKTTKNIICKNYCKGRKRVIYYNFLKEKKSGKISNLGKTEFVPANLSVTRFMKSFVVACN